MTRLLFPRISAASIEHLQLHQFCRWYAALSLFSIRDHSYFFTLVKLSCSRLSDSQGEMHAKLNVHGAEKRKRNRCPCYTTGSRLMNTKPLCLSHLEIDRWKLLWYISFFVNISFYFSAYFLLAWIFILYFPLPTPITFLLVHLTLRAEPPNLLSDAKWSSERMNSSAAERVHGQSLSFIQWRIQGRDPGGAGHPLFLDQTETRKAEKFFLETGSPLPHLRVWRTWTPPPPPIISRSGSGTVMHLSM